jgi:F0F1-type ATP synthase assembly protein I
MNGNNKASAAADRAAAEGRAQGIDTGWAVFSYLIGGMLAYGGIGWLIGRAVHVPLLFPAGMLVGMAISIGYIIHRYGRGDSHGRGDSRGHGSPPSGGRGGTGGKVSPRDRGAPGGRPPGLARPARKDDR